jgi:hypothetical protein
MARATPTLPISPRLFRHFAVITAAISACVAMFADGEGREAVANELAERQRKNELLIAEAAKVGTRSVGFDKAKAGRGAVAQANASVGEVDELGDFGAPMDVPAGSSDGGGGDTVAPSGPPRSVDIRIGAGPQSARPPIARQRTAPGAVGRAQFEKMLRESRKRSGAPE